MAIELYEEPCLMCGKIIPDYDPKMCCSGFECGCHGRPTEPPICSSACWDKINKRELLDVSEEKP